MTYKLTAEPRTLTGRKVKKLRAAGLVPGNVFGKDIKSFAVQLSAKEFNKVYEEAGETGIVELTIGKTTAPVLISNVQYHPVSDELLHVDFRQIDLTKKVTATVPVEVIGESPAEKSGIGTVVQQIDELQVEALPVDLPEKFEVDVSGLANVDDAIYIKDLKYDKTKVALEAAEDQIVVKVEPPQKEEVVQAPAEEVAEEGAEMGGAKPAGEGAQETPVGPKEQKE